ncbi:hypothetical protein BDC45DRAFT_567161 [Circinella umbellata]|nr:hypothetical protein BDC45DRAFT_567161 [Circinella umbellata]
MDNTEEEQYVLDTTNHPLTFKKIIEDNRKFIASKMNPSEDFQEIWNGHFTKAKSTNVDCDILKVAYFEYISNHPPVQQLSSHPTPIGATNTSDPVWHNYFTKEELHEIEDEKKKLLRSLWDGYKKHNIDPIDDPELYWVHSSVRNVLEILTYDLHKTYKTKADLMKRVWSIIDCCFDYGDLDVISEYV